MWSRDTVEQHGFELHGSTYTWIFSRNIQSTFCIPEFCRIFDLWLGICGCVGPVYAPCGFFPAWAVGASHPCLVRGSAVMLSRVGKAVVAEDQAMAENM